VKVSARSFWRSSCLSWHRSPPRRSRRGRFTASVSLRHAASGTGRTGPGTLIAGTARAGIRRRAEPRVERRWAEGRAERYTELAAELVGSRRTSSSRPLRRRRALNAPLRRSYRHGDRRRSAGTGLVASLARPGGNITGMSLQNSRNWPASDSRSCRKRFPRCGALVWCSTRRLPHRDSSFVIWRPPR